MQAARLAAAAARLQDQDSNVVLLLRAILRAARSRHGRSSAERPRGLEAARLVCTDKSQDLTQEKHLALGFKTKT